MKERNEQELIALEACNLLMTIHDRLMDLKDLYLSDLRDIESMKYNLINAFDFSAPGFIHDDGKIRGDCCGELLLKDDPKSYMYMKKNEKKSTKNK